MKHYYLWEIMKITIKTGLIFAMAWITIKMVFHLNNMTEVSIVPTIFINMFVLLCAISIGLYFHKKTEGFSQGNAMNDIKSAMKVGIPYTLVVALFIYLYYSKINPEYISSSLAEAEMSIKIAVDDPEQLKLIRAEQEAFEVMSKEKIYEELVQGPRNFISAKSAFIVSLLGMVMLTTFYSILVTIIFRKVLLRERK
jgi:5-bromo-4-chloroindolyl phosphate hydrolysis protein